MARNRRASIAGILMIILLLTMVQPSNAAELAYNCSVSQGFNLQNEGQALVGHIETLRSDDTLTADFPVIDPHDLSSSSHCKYRGKSLYL